MYCIYSKIIGPPGRVAKVLRIMKIVILLLITAVMQVSANVLAQKITLNEKSSTIEKVFDGIKNQTGYDFLVNSSILKSAGLVTINVTNTELTTVLEMIFKNQPLDYSIEDRSIVVFRKKSAFADHSTTASPPVDISGRVIDSTGRPLIGAQRSG
jgi:hypothetical protein